MARRSGRLRPSLRRGADSRQRDSSDGLSGGELFERFDDEVVVVDVGEAGDPDGADEGAVHPDREGAAGTRMSPGRGRRWRRRPGPGPWPSSPASTWRSSARSQTYGPASGRCRGWSRAVRHGTPPAPRDRRRCRPGDHDHGRARGSGCRVATLHRGRSGGTAVAPPARRGDGAGHRRQHGPSCGRFPLGCRQPELAPLRPVQCGQLTALSLRPVMRNWAQNGGGEWTRTGCAMRSTNGGGGERTDCARGCEWRNRTHKRLDERRVGQRLGIVRRATVVPGVRWRRCDARAYARRSCRNRSSRSNESTTSSSSTSTTVRPTHSRWS